MDNYNISIKAFESIIRNLVKLEEEQHIIVEYFAKSAAERSEIVNIIENYIKTIDQFIINSKQNSRHDRKLPFATIGCEIEVENMFNQNRHKFRLISALEENLIYGDVSFLSSLGQTLLLKRPGSIVEVDLPAGRAKCRIISINAII
ncbi:GreA/GreB family elongation factor [Pelotomaculum propionicicum]|uniref:Transcription elongation factor GreA n=1 Tax=Pelotomaculum propionicicum TaxID=258475 RepID=A0A4Y7RPA3_9FIRM|nr:GreA/GreB family elongation factor [Pelotomaculum propionicicum]NLI13236.1 GreA/GreB family elongation factor [Peptococcaceae bacterium]TEB10502.1 Transcription elongation factor GreA [Pelotomaculum propionicicum]